MAEFAGKMIGLVAVETARLSIHSDLSFGLKFPTAERWAPQPSHYVEEVMKWLLVSLCE